jgi:hypothetical protein
VSRVGGCVCYIELYRGALLEALPGWFSGVHELGVAFGFFSLCFEVEVSRLQVGYRVEKRGGLMHLLAVGYNGYSHTRTPLIFRKKARLSNAV